MNHLSSFTGKVRRFGFSGPIYEVIADAADDAIQFVRIRLIESGEEIDYPRDAMLKDPVEA